MRRRLVRRSSVLTRPVHRSSISPTGAMTNAMARMIPVGYGQNAGLVSERFQTVQLVSLQVGISVGR
jgi:hypothetical protein